MNTSITAEPQTGESEPNGAVFLDFDDALISGSSWRILHQHFGVVDEANEHYRMFSEDEITFSEWGDLDAGLWEGFPAGKIATAAEGIECISGMSSTIQSLRSDGFVVGIVSGGVRQLIAEIIAGEELDFLKANSLTIKDATVTGKVDMAVTPDTKQGIFEEIAHRNSLSMDQTVAIGNSSDDFQRNLRGLQIGLNPSDESTRELSDQIVEGERIDPVLPIIQNWFSGS